METEGRGLEPEPKLPRASVDKIISNVLENRMVCSREVKHLLLNACAEFVHILATESNEICEKEQRKTVTHEHVYTALSNLGYKSYIPECTEEYKEYQEQSKLRPSKQNKFKESGLTQDELEREQEELFRKAKLIAFNEDNQNHS
ncbi:down-regulator of transcription 1 [Nematocida sp. AWRm80]|nr:down-regulator of transcription 1 [Nematocida sp. AWRm80]